ncbi:transcriptional regulator [Planotetraspora silvatica]|uniref:Transcriptional regulator n=2 Tax=Planotetraspora silvatica TaxID=234614 RepID=A0A8J3URL6_9ACTN|nr:transcriptional regulator [Planotetraspora silvatica]
MLAGVSSDYYSRLEQGRERNPSDQVLEALARVLQLDAEATEHLHELAHLRAGRRRSVDRVDHVNPIVLRLMESWDHAPAYVINRRLDVLARNARAAALYAGLEHSDNMMRLTFLNPAAHEFYLDWRQEACSRVAHLRAMAGTDCDDPALLELVEELSRGSEDFRQIWARYDVRARTHESIGMRHREIGDVFVSLEVLTIDSASSQKLIVFQADPGSPSEEALARLGRLTASSR